MQDPAVLSPSAHGASECMHQLALARWLPAALKQGCKEKPVLQMGMVSTYIRQGLLGDASSPAILRIRFACSQAFD